MSARAMGRSRAGKLVGAALLTGVVLAAACQSATTTHELTEPSASKLTVDSVRLLDDLSRLADDSVRGRASGTPENAEVRAFIAARFDELGLGTLGSGRIQPFTFVNRRDSAAVAGANVVGVVRGTEYPERYIVISAHYDHVGVGRPVDGDSIYNGADDNASGTAALLDLARFFKAKPARHSLIFAAFDAEERGLQGARAFLANPPVDSGAIVLDINMDMVSHSERGELYAAGAAKWPALRPALVQVAVTAPVTLLLGHDSAQPNPRDDWTMQSDQGPFHQAGIPFVYFGVEDHPDYHKPSDEVGSITVGFYVNAVRTVLQATLALDAALTP